MAAKAYELPLVSAHVAFDEILGWLSARWLGFETSPACDAVEVCLAKQGRESLKERRLV